MTTTLTPPDAPISAPRLADVEVVLPVYNEAAALEPCVRRLRHFLDTSFPFPATVTIADNASTDGTWAIASELAATLSGVHAVRLEQKGRGRALRTVWSASAADIVAYMDVDLSTDLDGLLPLVAPLISGHSDLAIGSRLARGARVVRGPKRELISRCYNLLVHAVLHNGFTDAQCGFKAMRRSAAAELLPLVADNEWFFDTELLVLAERNGLRIYEVPVDWVDDPHSSVHLARTALDDLRGVWRLLRGFVAGQGRTEGPPSRLAQVEVDELARFAGVGLVSTVVYAALFLLLRPVAGLLGANALALLVCTLGNTVAHGRVTFAGRGVAGWRGQLAGSAVVVATTLALTTVALWCSVAVAPGSVVAEVLAIVAGTAVAALVRFVVLKAWVFRTHATGHHLPLVGEGSVPR